MPRRIVAAALVAAALLLLSGCVDVRYHLTVNRDGSGAVNVKVLYNDLTLLLLQETGNDPLPRLADQLQQQGFSVAPVREQGRKGLVAARELETLAEAIPSFAGAGTTGQVVGGEGLNVRRGWFRINYRLSTRVDPAKLAETDGLYQLDAYVAHQVNYEFALTLPITPDNHNAARTEDGGQTLVWNVVPGRQNMLLVEASHWNPAGLAATAVVLFAGLAAAAYLLRRKRK